MKAAIIVCGLILILNGIVTLCLSKNSSRLSREEEKRDE